MIETHDNIQSLVGVLTEEPLEIQYDAEGNVLLGHMVFKQDDNGPSVVVDYLKPEKTYETPEEVLATLPVSNKDDTHIDFNINPFAYMMISNQIALETRRGLGKMLSIENLGTFIAYSSDTINVDRPILQYTTKDGKTYYVPHVAINKMVKRFK